MGPLHEHDNGQNDSKLSFFKSPVGVAAAMRVLIAAFYVLREHWQHVAVSWPYLLLLACPLMHVFHSHGGHGGLHHETGNAQSDPNKKSW